MKVIKIPYDLSKPCIVSKWESGIIFPRIDKVKKFASLFGCTVGEIMESWKGGTE